MAIITLTSDFGPQAVHVAELKGVLLGLCPGATLIDISHGGRPFDIAHAGYIVARAAQRFPAGTVHLVWVNPEIGRPRSALAVRSAGQWFVAPDNGALSRIQQRDRQAGAYELDPTCLGNPRPASAGLDVLAPAAARLASGIGISLFGRPAAAPVISKSPLVQKSGHWVEGVIEHIDRFGNAWTNITRQDVADAFADSGKPPAALAVHVCDAHIEGISDGLGRYPQGAAVAFFNGPDLLEIAVNHGDAAARFKLSVGNSVRVAAGGDPGSEPFRG